MSKKEELTRLRQIAVHQGQRDAAVEEVGELVPLGQPDNIPSDVWSMIQENGRIATERLNELLTGQRFHRLRASDQAKLIKLAQDRAYGAVAAPKQDMNKGRYVDMTAEQMGKLQKRALLPEYKNEN